MVQLRILNGKLAGTECVARRFPFQIGRAPASDLHLEEDGVWDDHLEINLQSDHAFHLTVRPDTHATVNGQPVSVIALRNGDLIEAGAAQMRFALSPTRQRGLRWREVVTWLALGTLCLGQVALIYWLLE